jgi:hypothetical protein
VNRIKGSVGRFRQLTINPKYNTYWKDAINTNSFEAFELDGSITRKQDMSLFEESGIRDIKEINQPHKKL